MNPLHASISDRSRRRFVQQIATHIIGQGGAYGIYGIMQRARTQGRNVGTQSNRYLEGAGEQRLYNSAAKTVDEFTTAQSGVVLFWYQNFWPLHAEPKEFLMLDRLCRQPSKVAGIGVNIHRAVVLPAIARLHALPSAMGERAEELRAGIHTVHQQALDHNRAPNREVLDAVWHCATAVLIRNRASWRFTDFGHDLIDDAAAVCYVFLDGALELFEPAIVAWQFLLTYERALAERGDDLDLARLRLIMKTIRSNKLADQSYWFNTLESLYAPRVGLESMLPSLSEMVLGQINANFIGEDAINFAVRVRLQHTYLMETARNAPIAPIYFNLARKNEQPRGYSFLQNYGFTPDRWQALGSVLTVSDVRVGFMRKAHDYWSDQFSDERRHLIALSKFETSEAPSAAVLQSLFPFRSVDTQRLASRAFQSNELTLDFLTSVIGRAGHGMDRVLALWQAPAAMAAKRVADACDLGDQPPVTSLEPPSEMMEALKANEHILNRIWEEDLRPTTRTSKGAFNGSLAEGAADLHEEEVTAMPDQRISNTEALEVYNSVKDELEASHAGKYVQIKVDTKEYVIGDSFADVMNKFQQKFGYAVSCSTRVGNHIRVSRRIEG